MSDLSPRERAPGLAHPHLRAADHGPPAEQPRRRRGLPCARRPVPAAATDGGRPAAASATRQIRHGSPQVRPPGSRPLAASGQRDDEALEAGAVQRRGGGRVPAQRAGRQPAVGTPARPDVRTHIPPLGASQNRRGTASAAAPRLAEHRGHGLPVSKTVRRLSGTRSDRAGKIRNRGLAVNQDRPAARGGRPG